MPNHTVGLVILLVILLIGLACLLVPIWALADVGSKPSAAFRAAGSSKGMWMTLIIVFWLLTGLVGLVLAIVYMASVRPRVGQAMVQGPPGNGARMPDLPGVPGQSA